MAIKIPLDILLPLLEIHQHPNPIRVQKSQQGDNSLYITDNYSTSDWSYLRYFLGDGSIHDISYNWLEFLYDIINDGPSRDEFVKKYPHLVTARHRVQYSTDDFKTVRNIYEKRKVFAGREERDEWDQNEDNPETLHKHQPDIFWDDIQNAE